VEFGSPEAGTAEAALQLTTRPRGALSLQAQQAYEIHDPAAAHNLSTEGHAHQAAAASYNAQASSLILKANNAGLPADVLDLHGQFVDEARAILEARIAAARAQGVRGRLHVVVGRGVHSVGHVQKIKPAVEEICRKQGLAFGTEANEGRVWVDLGGEGQGSPQYGQGSQTYGGDYGPPQQQQQYQQSPPHQQQQNQQLQYPQQQQHDMQYSRPQQMVEQGGQSQQSQQAQEDMTSSCLKMLRGCCSVM